MRYIGLTLLMVMCSCQSLNTVNRARIENKGTTKTYDVNLEEAWDIARKCFRWGGADVIEEHRDKGYMLTSSGNNFVTSGAVMGAWLESAGNNRTTVTVITKRRIAIDLYKTMTEKKWHKYFAEGVRLTNHSEELPVVKPDLN